MKCFYKNDEPRQLSHEKLKVYQAGLDFLPMKAKLLNSIARPVAACDHLDRASESIVLNIAHVSNTKSSPERITYLGHANGSALECAACLDILVAKKMLRDQDVYQGKQLLSAIVSMLIGMKSKTAQSAVCETQAAYETSNNRLFSHEKLDVYRISLEIISWLEGIYPSFSCSTDIISKLDKSTTAVTLNIAEGNGRFSGMDHARFIEIAHKAATQTFALVDIATIGCNNTQLDHGRQLLRSLDRMLKSFSKVVRNNA